MQAAHACTKANLVDIRMAESFNQFIFIPKHTLFDKMSALQGEAKVDGKL